MFLPGPSLKVHLGGGIWVEEEKWHQLQRTQGDSKFTKNLAVMIWGTETLKNRSVTGVATKKKKDALPKPPLSPSKLKIVRGEVDPESREAPSASFSLVHVFGRRPKVPNSARALSHSPSLPRVSLRPGVPGDGRQRRDHAAAVQSEQVHL